MTRDIKKSFKISKNCFDMFIWLQQFTEYHLPHYEIPKPSQRYQTSKDDTWLRDNFEVSDCKLAKQA